MSAIPRGSSPLLVVCTPGEQSQPCRWYTLSLRFFYFLIFIYLFIFLFLAALGLRCCARAFSSCGEQGLLFVAVLRLLIAVASLVAEYGL